MLPSSTISKPGSPPRKWIGGPKKELSARSRIREPAEAAGLSPLSRLWKLGSGYQHKKVFPCLSKSWSTALKENTAITGVTAVCKTRLSSTSLIIRSGPRRPTLIEGATRSAVKRTRKREQNKKKNPKKRKREKKKQKKRGKKNFFLKKILKQKKYNKQNQKKK